MFDTFFFFPFPLSRSIVVCRGKSVCVLYDGACREGADGALEEGR